MTVQCPQCSTRYQLPERLMGPGGARVRCPRCGVTFVVAREPVDAPAADETATVEQTRETTPQPEALAAVLLAGLEERLGARLETARGHGSVLSDFGPELLAAWDAFRAQLGNEGSAEVFRTVLRERWAVDLGAPRIR